MGTNFYFFRHLTQEEQRAIQIVSGLYGDDAEWTPPEPLAVPDFIQQTTMENKVYMANRMGRVITYFGSGSKYQNHIGKRSAVGHYCWNCKLAVQSGFCLKCGLTPNDKPAVGLGVKRCCTFSWALDSVSFRAWADLNHGLTCIRDDYGDFFQVREFLEMLEKTCPIEVSDSIGVEFS